MNEEIRRARRSLGDAKDPNMKLLLLFVLLLPRSRWKDSNSRLLLR
jgi:hypothetical protein